MPAPDEAAKSRPGAEAGLRDPDGLVGRTVAGKYEVHDVLAKGGMGRIYRATQVPLGRPVALKVLHDELDETGTDSSGFQKRFLLEAASCARLRHPNIVVVYDYGKLDDTKRGAFFMAMELIEGPTLGQVLRDGPMQSPRALKIAREIARALREAHRQGMVHRDLKPSNVMIVLTPEGEQVKVLDFGLVKVARDDSEELTKEGHFLGSPKYMAPEQIKRGPVDGRADLYALGVLLYHMLAGQVPFEGEQAVQTLMAHLNDPPPPLPLRGDLTTAVRQIVMRCLEKEPDLRFPTAEALIRAIDEAAPGIGGLSQETSAISASGEVLASGEAATLASSSSSISRDLTLARQQPATPASSRRGALVAGVVIALAAASAAALAFFLPPADPDPAPAPVPAPVAAATPDPPPADRPRRRRFMLFVASSPSGATVTRGDETIGVTPTFAELDADALEEEPAHFRVALAGHAPFVFRQGPSDEDVHVVAELQPTEVAPPPEAPPETPSVTRRRPPRGGGAQGGGTTTPPPAGEEAAIKTRR